MPACEVPLRGCFRRECAAAEFTLPRLATAGIVNNPTWKKKTQLGGLLWFADESPAEYSFRKADESLSEVLPGNPICVECGALEGEANPPQITFLRVRLISLL